MELYLDSANLEHIRHAHSLGIISGITTNPSLLAKEDPKVDVKKRILEIFKLVGGHLSVEVISTDTKGMLKEADEILKWFPDATIKIPMIPSGLAAVRYLSDNDIPTNVTLIFSANQAIAAQNAGASYVSVFMGRLDDISVDCNRVLEDIGQIWDVQGYDSLIIAASLRNPIHLTQAAMAGAHIATVPYNVLMQSLNHPLTDSGLKKFLEDNAKLQEEIKRLSSPIKVSTQPQVVIPASAPAKATPTPVAPAPVTPTPVVPAAETPAKVIPTPAAPTPVAAKVAPTPAAPAQQSSIPATGPIIEPPKINQTKPVSKANRRGGNATKQAKQ
jgi:transaldolase